MAWRHAAEVHAPRGLDWDSEESRMCYCPWTAAPLAAMVDVPVAEVFGADAEPGWLPGASNESDTSTTTSKEPGAVGVPLRLPFASIETPGGNGPLLGSSATV